LYRSGYIGSRNAQTSFYYDKGFSFVRCGCFYGDLKAFEKKVKKTYSDKENSYRIEYDKLIKTLKKLYKEAQI
jgi:hypothetical protein